MVSPLPLYPHQLEAIDHAKAKNTIVNLATGMGKTLIAAKLIEHYLLGDPTKKVAFLVPTRALVEQQSKYCRNHCRLLLAPGFSPPTIQQLVGQDQSDWSQSDWDNSTRTSHIFLGTAELLREAFISKHLDISRFSLIVFDECHNACGNSPMAVVMRDVVAPHQAKGFVGPRILGLTASFVNGSMKNIEKKRRQLETLLLSTIICPDVQVQIGGDERFESVEWSKAANTDKHMEAIETHVEAAVQHLGGIAEVSKVIRNCAHVFEELGCDALMFYIDKVIVEQVAEKARDSQEDKRNIPRMQLGMRLQRAIPHLKGELKKLRQKLEADPVVQQADKKNPKVRRLIDLLLTRFRENQKGYRGIVFVEQVALVSSLAKVLNDSLTILQIQCGAVAGTGSQSECERRIQLQKFRSGEIQILVSTPTLEEGIDVSECAFVVRYTSIATTKAHIQGAGRARHPNAVVFYFENDPDLECRKEKALNATARDKSLSLTTQELQGAVSSINIPFDQRHPYPYQARRGLLGSDTGEINVFNCKQIFNQYCSMVLGASIQPKKMLYQFHRRSDGSKLLSRVRYPSPNGWVSLSDQDFESFWGKTNFDQIFSPGERIKRKSSSEKQEMCFVYMIAVHLREDGYLDSHNRPNRSIEFEVRRNCPLDANWPPKISIHNRVFQSNRGVSPT